MKPKNSEKWQAVLHCDESFDGQFYYGVKTTGIFCRPSCKSKPPLAENVEFFDTPAAACAQGLRPCKRCRPDLLEYRPTQDLLRQVKALYDNDFADREQLASQLRQLPVSLHHLTRLFRQEFGLTPTEYLNNLRLGKAVACLSDPALRILDVAYVCGFGSLSRFYACFRKQFGVTPSEYRRQKMQWPQQELEQ
jgi:AraC family transcriptional regulator of adaptative response / methylphosphotriester-DNA alkyltransferase methyltransferase